MKLHPVIFFALLGLMIVIIGFTNRYMDTHYIRQSELHKTVKKPVKEFSARQSPSHIPESLIFTGYIVDSTQSIPDGALIIENKKIKWVGKKSEMPDSTAEVIAFNGYIYPGFIDSHNHVMYNFLPKWRIGKLFNSRYDWQQIQEYDDVKYGFNKAVDNNSLKISINKYGELKALIAGTTMIQGTWYLKGTETLVRNLESYNLCKTDTVSQSVFPLRYSNENIVDKMNSGEITSFIIHAGEGVDAAAKEEFYTLKKQGLLRRETAIIHGTAFGEPEFKEMAAHNVGLIWSPQSNMWLYNTCTRADIADKAGVTVALAPDWSVTSGDNILEEVVFAAKVNREMLNSYFSDKDFFDMITLNPAKITGFDDCLGTLEAGKEADIVLVGRKDNDPYSNIQKISLNDIAGVFIHGEVYYGTPEIVKQAGKENDNEIILVNGIPMAIDVTEDFKDVPESGEKLYDFYKLLKSNIPDIAPLAKGVEIPCNF